MPFPIVDLTRDKQDLIEQAARLLQDAFRDRSEDWQDVESARQEVLASLAPDRISRALIDESGAALGWIGGISTYGGRVWEVHPLVVSEAHRRRGIGRALVEDLERLAAGRGALTLWAGSDDENNETTLSGVDLYPDIPGAIRNIRNLRQHPYEFYTRLGFRIAGVLPDANGPASRTYFLPGASRYQLALLRSPMSERGITSRRGHRPTRISTPAINASTDITMPGIGSATSPASPETMSHAASSNIPALRVTITAILPS